jgi:hypothetical protein
MGDQRFRNVQWALPVTSTGTIQTWEAAQIAVLMDIRDELQQLNTLLGCRNFTQMPRDLRAMAVEARAHRLARLARQRRAPKGGA